MATSQQSAPAVISPRPTSARRATSYTFLRVIGWTLLYATAILTAVIFSLPFLWTLGSSLKSMQEIFLFPPTMFPAEPRWQNYADVFQLAPFGTFIINTVIITALAMIG